MKRPRKTRTPATLDVPLTHSTRKCPGFGSMKANHPVQPARRRVGGWEETALQRALTRVPSRSNLHTEGEDQRMRKRQRCLRQLLRRKVRDFASFLYWISTSVLKSPLSRLHPPARVSRERSRNKDERETEARASFTQKIFV